MKKTKWSVTISDKTFYIRRAFKDNEGKLKQERLLVSKDSIYKELKQKLKKGQGSRKDFENHATLLNRPILEAERIRKDWSALSPYFPDNLYDTFNSWITDRGTKEYNASIIRTVNNYVLQFYLRENEITNYREWRKLDHQRDFINWLKAKKTPAKIIDKCKYDANILLKYLCDGLSDRTELRDLVIDFPSFGGANRTEYIKTLKIDPTDFLFPRKKEVS